MPRPRTAPRALRVLTLAVPAALLLAGCTLSGSDPDPAPPTDQAVQEEQTPEPSVPRPDESPDRPSPEDISAGILDLAAVEPATPLGSQTVEIQISGGDPAAVTVEVLALQRTRDATHLRMQMSTSEPVGLPDYGTFSDRGSPNRQFLERLNLLDAQAGVRHYPLSWRRAELGDEAPADGPPDACVCPFLGQSFTLSPTPMVMDVMFGPLPPEVTTVALEAPGGLAVGGLGIDPADG